MGALDLIIARGFGDQVRDIATSGSRAVEWQNQRKAEEQAASINEFNLKSSQQNQAAQLQDRARLQGAQAEIDGILSEIAALDQQAQAAGQNIPPEMAARSAELMRRLQIAAMKGQNPAQLSQMLSPRASASQAKPVIVQGPNGPMYVDASQAAGMPAYVRPSAPQQAPTSRFTPVQVQQPDGTVQTVMVDTTNPENRISVGDAPAKQNTKVPDVQTAQRAYNAFDGAMKNVEKAFADTWTGPVAGIVPPLTSNQQKAKGSVALLAPILKQLFRTAGEGVFTDKDQQLLLDMAPQRTDTPEVVAFKVQAIRETVAAKLGIEVPSAPPPALSNDPAARQRIRIDADGNVIP